MNRVQLICNDCNEYLFYVIIRAVTYAYFCPNVSILLTYNTIYFLCLFFFVQKFPNTVNIKSQSYPKPTKIDGRIRTKKCEYVTVLVIITTERECAVQRGG